MYLDAISVIFISHVFDLGNSLGST